MTVETSAIDPLQTISIKNVRPQSLDNEKDLDIDVVDDLWGEASEISDRAALKIALSIDVHRYVVGRCKTQC